MFFFFFIGCLSHYLLHGVDCQRGRSCRITPTMMQTAWMGDGNVLAVNARFCDLFLIKWWIWESMSETALFHHI